MTGLKQQLDDYNIEISHAAGSRITEVLDHGIEEAKKASENADIIILTLGGSSAREFATMFDANGAALNDSNEMTSGENIDLADLNLSVAQIELAKDLSQLNISMVAVLIEGRSHALGELEALADAILIAGYPGDQEEMLWHPF